MCTVLPSRFGMFAAGYAVAIQPHAKGMFPEDHEHYIGDLPPFSCNSVSVTLFSVTHLIMLSIWIVVSFDMASSKTLVKILHCKVRTKVCMKAASRNRFSLSFLLDQELTGGRSAQATAQRLWKEQMHTCLLASRGRMPFSAIQALLRLIN